MEMRRAALLRYPLALLAAMVASYGLFYFMQRMTLQNHTDSAVVSAALLQPIQFIRIKRKESVETKKRKAAKPAQIKPPTPRTIHSTQIKIKAPKGEALPPLRIPAMGGTNLSTGLINLSLGGIAVDEEIIPLFRVPPIYPHRAAKRGVEGWVKVGFTITTTGTVKNPHVIEASPKGMFDSSALRAISRWKFKPKIVGGTVVEREGTQSLTFSIEKKK